MKIATLFHTGYKIIEHPDIRIGRKNADFGQGFYLSDNEAFVRRWAKSNKQQTTYLNQYRIDYSNLSIKYLERDEEWFQYIFQNRKGGQDCFKAYDIVMGPIANDTIYNLAGITTSGLIDKKQALDLLMVGPEYQQIAIKTEKAVNALRFIDATILTKEQIETYRNLVKIEEEEYQKQVGELLMQMSEK